MRSTSVNKLALYTWLCVCMLFLASPFRAAGQTISGFQRGDCNGDTVFDVTDAVHLLDVVFLGEPTTCADACDVNDDGNVDVSDAIAALSSLFMGAPWPAPNTCGEDPTPDSLDCQNPTCTVLAIDGERAFTLPTGKLGMAYEGRLPVDFQSLISWSLSGGTPNIIQPQILYEEYGLPVGASLPSGLMLDPMTGQITGSPTQAGFYQFPVWARWSAQDAVTIHVQLAVFSPDENEIVPGQDLRPLGPYSITVVDDGFSFLHENPWPPPYPLWNCSPSAPPGPQTIFKPYQLYIPNSTGPAPLLVFHHGTGFEHNDYGAILNQLASHGVICVSVADAYSYSLFSYLAWYCWGGHDEGARVMLAARDLMESLSQDPTSPLFERVDRQRIFYGGHSRGGASALIAAEMDRNTRGVISLQPTDAKGDSWIGRTNRWNRLPSVPVLSISAEQDFDVIFPFAERLLERFSGITTQVTIYGGCHGFTSNTNPNGCALCLWSPVQPAVDTCAYITRSNQLEWTKQFATAFMYRHAFGDLSVEGLLYGDEYQTSAEVGVAHRRQLGSALVVDDFDDFPVNRFGNLTASSGNVLIGACYDVPGQPPAPLLPISNLVIGVPSAPAQASHDSPLGTSTNPLDASAYRSLEFRIKNADRWNLVDNFGFSWLEATVSLEDAAGNSALVNLGSYFPSTTFHPDPDPASANILMKYQRFITIRVPLADFEAANPNLSLDALTQLGWTWSTVGATNTPPFVAIDDVSFE